MVRECFFSEKLQKSNSESKENLGKPHDISEKALLYKKGNKFHFKDALETEN